MRLKIKQEREIPRSGGLGSQEWSFPVRVSVRLTAKSEEGGDDLTDVLFLPELYRLENIYVRHTVLLDGFLELVDVLHHLEITPGRVDFADGSGLDLVDQFTENLSVAQVVLEGSVELPADDRLDPFLGFLLLLGIAFRCDLGADLTFESHSVELGYAFEDKTRT